MKTSLAIACLLNSAVAVRFFSQNEMSDDEVKESLASIMESQGIHQEGRPKATFSKVLKTVEKGGDIAEKELASEFISKAAVIQPNDVRLSRKQEQ